MYFRTLEMTDMPSLCNDWSNRLPLVKGERTCRILDQSGERAGEVFDVDSPRAVREHGASWESGIKRNA